MKVSQGPLKLNGMEIVPDAGVQLQIDLNAKTIRSTGTATVLLRAPGVPDITLFRGRIDLSAAGKGAGAVLGQFGEKLFKPDLLGFPLKGDIDLKLAPPDGLRIPVSLELPKELGNIRGSAELLLDNTHGLVLDSLDFSADGVPLGPATMRKLQVQYRAQGGTTVGYCLVPPSSGAPAQANEWAGVFELELPPPKTGPRVCGSIRFGQPEGFREATFRVDIPYPGIVLFPGLSLTSLGGGLRLSPKPARVDGRFKIEVAGAAPDVSAAQMVGELGVTLSEPPRHPGARHLHRRRPADRDRAGHGDDRRLRQPLAGERPEARARSRSRPRSTGSSTARTASSPSAARGGSASRPSRRAASRVPGRVRGDDLHQGRGRLPARDPAADRHPVPALHDRPAAGRGPALVGREGADLADRLLRLRLRGARPEGGGARRDRDARGGGDLAGGASANFRVAGDGRRAGRRPDRPERPGRDPRRRLPRRHLGHPLPGRRDAGGRPLDGPRPGRQPADRRARRLPRRGRAEGHPRPRDREGRPAHPGLHGHARRRAGRRPSSSAGARGAA